MPRVFGSLCAAADADKMLVDVGSRGLPGYCGGGPRTSCVVLTANTELQSYAVPITVCLTGMQGAVPKRLVCLSVGDSLRRLDDNVNRHEPVEKLSAEDPLLV